MISDGCFKRQLRGSVAKADVIVAALDCATKSRIRELPCKFNDGRPVPQPLRSSQYPLGLPSLEGPERAAVRRDNDASEYSLSEILG